MIHFNPTPLAIVSQMLLWRSVLLVVPHTIRKLAIFIYTNNIVTLLPGIQIFIIYYNICGIYISIMKFSPSCYLWGCGQVVAPDPQYPSLVPHQQT